VTGARRRPDHRLHDRRIVHDRVGETIVVSNRPDQFVTPDPSNPIDVA